MSRFINTELKPDSDSSDSDLDSEKVGPKLDAELTPKLKSGSITLNNFYPYAFDDFEKVLLMPIFLMEHFFSQALFQTFC